MSPSSPPDDATAKPWLPALIRAEGLAYEHPEPLEWRAGFTAAVRAPGAICVFLAVRARGSRSSR